jgi:hypothetical protein
MFPDDDAIHEKDVVAGRSSGDRDLAVDAVGADTGHEHSSLGVRSETALR